LATSLLATSLLATSPLTTFFLLATSLLAISLLGACLLSACLLAWVCVQGLVYFALMCSCQPPTYLTYSVPQKFCHTPKRDIPASSRYSIQKIPATILISFLVVKTLLLEKPSVGGEARCDFGSVTTLLRALNITTVSTEKKKQD
jgi:hypothetical protein